MTDPIPPYDEEAEQAVLGAMLTSPHAIPVAVEYLSASSFYGERHQDIYHAIMNNWSRSADSVDVVTVSNAVPDHRDYLHVLLERCPTASNTAHYAQIVQQVATQRDLIKAGHKIVEIGYSHPDDPAALIDSAEGLIHGLRPESDRSTHRLREGLHQWLKNLEDKTPPPIVSTGFRSIDKVTGGLHEGNFVVVGARPGIGKTCLALAIAERVARKELVLFFSLEMSYEEVLERLICSLSSVPMSAARHRRLDKKMYAQVLGIINDIERSDLRIHDASSLSLLDLKAKCRQFSAKRKIGLIVIDYLQLMTLGKRTESRFHEVSTISRELKGLARDLSVPVMALSQLNRESQFQGTKPELHQLRETGSLEQDADMVWLLSWPKDGGSFGGQSSVIIDVAKNRHGPPGEVEMVWYPDYQRFDE